MTYDFDTLELDADALALGRALNAVLPRPFHEIGVDRARELVSSLRPTGPYQHVWSVTEHDIPTRHGGVRVRAYRPGLGRSVVIYLHGGGFTLGTLDGVDAMCRLLAHKSDCTVVSVAYGLAPENKFPTALQQCVDVARWLNDHGGELSLNAERFVIAGDSAGANLAITSTLLLAEEEAAAPAALILAYPVTEYCVQRESFVRHADGPLLTARDIEWFWDQYLAGPADRSNPLAVPSTSSNLRLLPPTLMFTAYNDPLRDDGAQFAARMVAEGVNVDHRCVPGVFHGFFTEPGTLRAADRAIDVAADYARSVLIASEQS
ncbi:alpha/beta hydrolase [Mycolicibacterium wolinskyi]|uniref:Alpha/beta hydrolase fold-3 domain-containing protein n=1 Tax=Mycolicibacterium wolinskyi TaxID=59750 RepID=A0A1X2F1U7_9MYCO|nr:MULTISPECIES: alpha/beta hydrolase [Mycolicibacterium]MCV7287822.1 alpha/beta hydrolase [Mycolicibacterium wolinskyi]MCV7294720.1 alpha/beta hydrolase [Mycolicibacterium goodii]ORX12420.1 hypothetical protein AWC31_31010 [Mycolicibacterium wolinskyi]